MRRIYLDSCVVIYYMEGSTSLQQAIRRRLPSNSSAVTIFCSDLTRLECRVGPIKNQNRKLLLDYDSFFSSPELVLVPLTTAVFDSATELRAVYNVRTPDALHIAAALASGCNEFWTNDQRLQALSKKIHIEFIVDEASSR